MNKKECNIIMDLMPNYIEQEVSIDSKNFIEQHINECSECRTNSMKMKEKIIENEKKIKIDSEIMNKKINKIRRKMIRQKYLFSLVSVGLILVLVISLFCIIRNNYVLSNTYKNYQNVNSLNNFKVTTYSIYQNYNGEGNSNYYSILSYKNGKYKEELYDGISVNKMLENMTYGEIDSNERIKISISNKKMVKSRNSSIYYKKGQLISNTFVETLLDIKQRVNYIFGKVETREFGGKECYVYKVQWNKDGYQEYWIEKDTFFCVREIESYSSYYRENLYSIKENCITDEELQIPEEFQNYIYEEIETNEFTKNTNISNYIKENLKTEND